MFHRLSALCVAASVLAIAPAQSFANFLIDDFITVQNAEVTAAAPGIQSTGNVMNTASAIGVERDLYVEKTVGGDGERVRARVNPNGLDLLRMTVDDARGRVVVTWDGSDGLFGPGQVDYDGLGSIDFTVDQVLQILVTFSDVGGPVRLTFWDANDLTGNTYAQHTFNVPGGIPAASMVLLSAAFNNANFTAVGDSLSNILASVGAIQLEIDATAVAQQGWDMRIDFVRTVPEPATLAMLGLGFAGLLVAGRRKSS